MYDLVKISVIKEVSFIIGDSTDEIIGSKESVGLCILRTHFIGI